MASATTGPSRPSSLAAATEHLSRFTDSLPRTLVWASAWDMTRDGETPGRQFVELVLNNIASETDSSVVMVLLRQLATYYAKEPNHLFLVRIAQGLLHMGKGLHTLSPLQSDGMLLNRVSLAGLLTVLHASLDMKNTLLGAKRHYLLFSLVTAIRPRWLITLDGDSDDLRPIAVSVRVGTRVDPVGQAGKPETITGFQTHKTPVLLSATDRAELNSDEYIAMTRTLEGVVIVKKNPNYRAPH